MVSHKTTTLEQKLQGIQLVRNVNTTSWPVTLIVRSKVLAEHKDSIQHYAISIWYKIKTNKKNKINPGTKKDCCLVKSFINCYQRCCLLWVFLPGDMGRLELGEGVYGMGLDTVLARKPCADISLKYLKIWNCHFVKNKKTPPKNEKQSKLFYSHSKWDS